MKLAPLSIAYLGFLCPATILAQGDVPDVTPVLGQKGELLFEDDFEGDTVSPEWLPLHGTQWIQSEGVRRGSASTKAYQAKQIARNNKRHSGQSPTSKLRVATEDCIVLFRFKLTEGLNAAHFGFDDGNSGTGHVGRLIVSTSDGLAIQKDKNTKIKGDKDETLASDGFKVEPDRWYWMMLEVVGNKVAAQVSGAPVLRAEHPRFGMPKGLINLPNRGAGGVILYDEVRVWGALPLAKRSQVSDR